MDKRSGTQRYERNADNYDKIKNYRNRYSCKNIRSSFVDVDLDIQRDKKAKFKPYFIKNMNQYVDI